MKLLISGYCPHGNSGYGLQTEHLLRVFSKNHDVSLIFWDINEQTDRSTIAYSEFSKNKFGKDVDHDAQLYIPKKPLSNFKNEYWKDMAWAVNDFNPDRIVTIHDIWTIPTEVKPFDVPMYGWIPIHYDPPEVQTIVNLRNYDTVWSMSVWGKGVLQEYHHDVRYVPHFIDDVFFDGIFSNLERKRRVRRQLGIAAHAYVILMVARNTEKSNRKGFNIALNAFHAYRRIKNPIAHLHIHSNMNGAMDIKHMVDELKLEDCVSWTNQDRLTKYDISKEFMRDMYLASDVLLSTSAAEGFGLPNIEAQCCGVPVIATNCTAISESVFMGRVTEPSKALVGNEGSFSQPDVNNVFLDIMHVERNPYTQGEKNNVRTTLWSRFNKHSVEQAIEDGFTRGKTKTKMFHLPHELHTYKTGSAVYSYDGRTLHPLDPDDDAPREFDDDYDVIESDSTSKRARVRYMCDDHYITIDDKLYVGDEMMCDVQDTDQLCKFGGDVWLYNSVTGLRSHSSSKTIPHSDVIHGNRFDIGVLSIHCHDNKALIHLADGTALVHDLDENVSQKIVIRDIKVSCFVAKDDRILVFGRVDDEDVVKVLKYKNFGIKE